MNCTKAISLLTLLAFSSWSNAGEQTEAAAPDLDYRYPIYHAEYRVNGDGSSVATYTVATTVLKERAIDSAKRFSISFSTGVQKAEVIEAFTEKADGSRIDVPKDNFQVEENKGRNGDSPFFSDHSTVTVLFPDLGINDTVRLTYRISQTEATFPGHFSQSGSFPRDRPYEDVLIRIDYPTSLRAQYEKRDMEEQTSERDGRRTIEWRYANPHPLKSKRRDYSVYDPAADPGFAFSTFGSYREIAEAYGLRARPKAAVTDRVRRLAEEITAGKEKSVEQVQALYEWVATNITYGGHCIGAGAVVPRDIDLVLDNRMGDCKDHATLLQALLAAKGIASTQALVNAGNIYRLEAVPDVSMVNHVINYVPGMNLYLDSTSETTPFGLLPLTLFGKPVLLVDGYREGSTIPALPVGENRQEMKTVARIADDGSIVGTTEVSLRGHYAASTRAWMRRIPKDREAELIKVAFQRQGRDGSGAIERPDARELRSSYEYKVSFQMKDFLQRPGAGAFSITPLVFSEAPVGRFTAQAVVPVESADVACAAGYSSEEYQFELPKDMKLLSVPRNLSFENEYLAYRATYQVKGRILTVRRVIDDRTRGPVCSPAMLEAWRKLAAKALADGRAQIVYQ